MKSATETILLICLTVGSFGAIVAQTPSTIINKTPQPVPSPTPLSGKTSGTPVRQQKRPVRRTGDAARPNSRKAGEPTWPERPEIAIALDRPRAENVRQL